MTFDVRLLVLLLTGLFVTWGCTLHESTRHSHSETRSSVFIEGPNIDKRVSLGLGKGALEAHQAVMREHFKTVHEIMAALAEQKFEEAQELTETQLGFAKHREAMRQQKPEDFPPAYHDLAMAHHQAAESLANAIPSKNFEQILPPFERMLYACVQCHEKYQR